MGVGWEEAQRAMGGVWEPLSGQAPGRQRPTCDDVLNGTISPRKQAGAPLGLAPPQLCNQLLLLPLVPLRWGLGPSI